MKRKTTRYNPIMLLVVAMMLCVTGMQSKAMAQSGRVINQSILDAEELFKRGMKQRGQGNLQAAIRSFQGILSNNPELQRARLELAVAYYQALLFADAKKQAKLVLNDAKTPESVKKKIRAFLLKVEQAGTRHTFRPYVRMGFMYDTNANVGPDESVIAGIPNSGILPKQEDHAVLVQFGGLHRYIANRSVSFGNGRYALLWMSRANFYRTDYDKINDRDLDVFSLSTGPAMINARRWRAALNVQADMIRLGNESYATITGLNPNFIWIRDKQNTEITLDLHIQGRDYHRIIDAGQDSDFYAVGLSYGHLTKNRKFSYQFGFRLFSEDADASNFTNEGSEWFAGINYQINRYTNWYLRFSHKILDYDGVEPGYSVARDEQVDRFVLGYQKEFKGSMLDGWELKAHWTYTDSESNISEFEYDRSQFAVTVGKRF